MPAAYSEPPPNDGEAIVVLDEPIDVDILFDNSSPPLLEPPTGVLVEDLPILVDADNWFDTQRTVITPSGNELTVLAFTPFGYVSRGSQRLRVAMYLTVPILTLAGGLALWHALGTALKPVRRITNQANRIDPASSSTRLPVPTSDDEIAELTIVLNSMLDRLDDGLTRQRQFVADASHELRSPLTAVKGTAELLAARPEVQAGAHHLARSLTSGTTRLEALLDDLIHLAEAGTERPTQPVDLNGMIRAEAADLILRTSNGNTDGAGAHIHIETERLDPNLIHAHPARLGRAIRNLFDNASRHATTRIAVTAETLADGGTILHVDDDGPGVPVSDRVRVFDRFVRLDTARARSDGGHGLGLAIVAATAQAHGGTATCAASPLGGARFSIHITDRAAVT